MFEKVPLAEAYWLKAKERLQDARRKGVAQLGMDIVYVIVAVLIAVILFAALYPTVVSQEQTTCSTLAAQGSTGAAALLKTTVETILPIAIVISILFVSIAVLKSKR
jgi:flagellar biosynthesis protein FlhB